MIKSKNFISTNPWDVTTLTFQSELDVSADFSYTNGIHIDESVQECMSLEENLVFKK